MPRPVRSMLAALLAAGSAAFAEPLAAQAPLAVTVAAGVSPYDLGGTGTAVVAAGRLDVRVAPFLVIEPGVGVLRYKQRFEPAVSYLLPEVGVHLQLPAPVVRPYVGGGAGMASVLAGGDGTELTLHAAAGARIAVPGGWLVRPEGRLRSFDPFAGSSVDLTIGVGRRF